MKKTLQEKIEILKQYVENNNIYDIIKISKEHKLDYRDIRYICLLNNWNIRKKMKKRKISIKDYQRQYYLRNREKINQYFKNYIKNKKEKNV